MSVVSPIVSPFGSTGSGTSTFVSSDFAYDYALGGIGLLAAIDGDTPYQRRTAPYRKEQTDQSPEPGEQSLQFWWMRSQLSFHGGAGRRFFEPSGEGDTAGRIMFESSVGLDVWTPGKVTLLHSTSLLAAAGSSVFCVGAVDGTTPVLLQAEGATLKRVLADGTTSTITWGGSGTILSVASDGTNYYAADSTGIYTGTLAGGAGSLLWNTGSSRVLLGWVKQRLMAAVGPAVYELTGTGPALPAAKYTHPNSAWIWTALTEGPSEVLAAGYVGETSAVVRFALDSSGVVPTLTSAATVAQMPTGETIRSLYVYLGRLVGFGTDRGIRIGVLSDGQLTFGPLTVETDSPVSSFVGLDSFLYATCSNGIEGESGLLRIDLGSEVSPGRFAYATDLQAHQAGTVRSVSVLGDRLVFTVDGHGSFIEADGFEASGSLVTSRIRMGTLEPKLFKFLKLRTSESAGFISASVTSDTGNVSGALSGAGTAGDIPEVQISLNPAEFVQVTVSLAPSGAVSPEFQGYQLKALPAQKRQRLEVVPVLLFDFESDRSGQQKGRDGDALRRLLALEEMEESGDIVLFQHLTADPEGNTARLVVIDEVRFIQTSPPGRHRGWGGRCELILRSVT